MATHDDDDDDDDEDVRDDLSNHCSPRGTSNEATRRRDDATTRRRRGEAIGEWIDRGRKDGWMSGCGSADADAVGATARCAKGVKHDRSMVVV